MSLVWIFHFVPHLTMVQNEKTLWDLTYGRPNERARKGLPGPWFDVVVVSLGIVGAVGYLWQSAMG